jgi:hypothetical protein
MKKKCIRFLPLLLACLLLCGCFLEPAEGLYAVPKQSEEYYDLQNAIELALPDGAVYAPPVSGAPASGPVPVPVSPSGGVSSSGSWGVHWACQ